MAKDADLRTAGLKVTSARLAILQLLENADERHLSAEDIFHQLNQNNIDIAQATVYRVLSQFEHAGLVHKHRFDDDHSVFELNDGNHHDHIVCVQCHRIEEFLDPIIEKHQTKIAEKLGYKITDHCLYLYGICNDCQ